MMFYDTAAAELTAIKKAIAASDWGALGASAGSRRRRSSSSRRARPAPLAQGDLSACRLEPVADRSPDPHATRRRGRQPDQLSPIAADCWIAARCGKLEDQTGAAEGAILGACGRSADSRRARSARTCRHRWAGPRRHGAACAPRGRGACTDVWRGVAQPAQVLPSLRR